MFLQLTIFIVFSFIHGEQTVWATGLCLAVTDINISEPGSQSVGLAWVCFVGICRHCRGFPVHWLWNQFYPSWICQSQNKVEGNTIQHFQFYKPGLLEGKVLLKVKCAISVPSVAPNGIIKIMIFKLIFNLSSTGQSNN